MMDYMNGTAPGGIKLERWQLPVSGCWWPWGELDGQLPSVLAGGWEPRLNRFRAEQKAVWSRLLFDRTAAPIENAAR